MKKQRKKGRIKINQGRLLVTVLVIVLLAVVGMSLKNVVSLHYEQSKLEEEHSNLKAEKNSLTEELKSVNDSSYIEEQARIQLRMIKPGEILYILGGNDDDSTSKEDKEKNEKNKN